MNREFELDNVEQLENRESPLLGPKLNYKPQKPIENISVCIEVIISNRYYYFSTLLPSL